MLLLPSPIIVWVTVSICTFIVDSLYISSVIRCVVGGCLSLIFLWCRLVYLHPCAIRQILSKFLEFQRNFPIGVGDSSKKKNDSWANLKEVDNSPSVEEW